MLVLILVAIPALDVLYLPYLAMMERYDLAHVDTMAWPNRTRRGINRGKYLSLYCFDHNNLVLERFSFPILLNS